MCAYAWDPDAYRRHSAAQETWGRELVVKLALRGDERVLDISSATLHWIPETRAVLASIRRALRPGGRVLLQMGGRGNAAGLMAALEEARTDPRWRDGFDGFVFPWHFHGAEEFAQWMAQAGLRPRRVELVPRTMSNPDRQAFAGWIRTACLPYVERVPAPLRDAFVDATVDAYLRKYPPGPDGAILAAMVRLEAEGDG